MHLILDTYVLRLFYCMSSNDLSVTEPAFKSANKTRSKTEHWASPAGHKHLICFCLKSEHNSEICKIFVAIFF